MGQDDGFFLPDFAANRKGRGSSIYVNDVPRGLLAASVTPEQSLDVPYGLRWVYSIMQAGDWLRFGVMIQGAPQALIRFEQYHENVLAVERIWDRSCDYQLRDSSGLLLEWRFSEPDFYKEFVIRERFLIMARHMHFRLGKVLRPLLDEISDLHAMYGSSWMNHHGDSAKQSAGHDQHHHAHHHVEALGADSPHSGSMNDGSQGGPSGAREATLQDHADSAAAALSLGTLAHPSPHAVFPYDTPEGLSHMPEFMDDPEISLDGENSFSLLPESFSLVDPDDTDPVSDGPTSDGSASHGEAPNASSSDSEVSDAGSPNKPTGPEEK
jgi:hypothetical protein